jgi:tetratricopeptide (TPR) repeat protein
VNGYWNWAGRYPAYATYATGVATGVAVGVAADARSSAGYANPYYTTADDSGSSGTSGSSSTTPYDYSQPLPTQYSSGNGASDGSTTDGGQGDSGASKVPPEATKAFAAARAAFKAKDYKTAEKEVNRAIKLMPADATLHEFRALVLFAQKQYQPAAATLHAVLAAGPGWDWDTVQSLYADTETYTSQLRALEAYQKANPKDAAASFVLAYHYLVLGHQEAAARQLENVVKWQPKDEVAVQLLKSLKKGEKGKPAPQE